VSRPTLGTHNLLDGAAPATPFTDVLFFTEAGGADQSRLIKAGYEIYTCHEQRDLVIAVNSDLGWDALCGDYRQALFGVRKVSPKRGTFWLTDDVAMVALIDEHRINAAFPPYIRGEKLFRKLGWWSHTRMTLRIIKRLKKQGYTIYAGGDLNTPKGVSGYKGQLHEVGDHFDRLGSTEELGGPKYLSKLESDHPRVKAWKKY
jgi:hypothetical protein